MAGRSRRSCDHEVAGLHVVDGASRADHDPVCRCTDVDGDRGGNPTPRMFTRRLKTSCELHLKFPAGIRSVPPSGTAAYALEMAVKSLVVPSPTAP